MSGYDAEIAKQLGRIATALENIAAQTKASNLIAVGDIKGGLEIVRMNK